VEAGAKKIERFQVCATVCAQQTAGHQMLSEITRPKPSARWGNDPASDDVTNGKQALIKPQLPARAVRTIAGRLRAVLDTIFSFTRMVWQGHRLRWEIPTITTAQRYLIWCPDEAFPQKTNFARLLPSA
jgi:hypothetical protein